MALDRRPDCPSVHSASGNSE